MSDGIPAAGRVYQHSIEGSLIPMGFAEVAALSAGTAAALPAVPGGTRLVLLNTEVQAIRWRDDGVDPTTTSGMPLPIGEYFIYSGNPATFKMISQVASAKVSISYYR
jgi:hypothetical protein